MKKIGTWTNEDTVNAQRNFKMAYDFKNEDTNERKTIYEVGRFKHYVLIHKKDGEVIGLHHAQNGLVLVLRHFKK